MDEELNKIKNKIKAVAKSLGRKALIVLLPVIIIVILLSSVVYYINVWADGKGDDDWSAAPYAAGQYTSNVTMSNTGELKSSMTAQELWDKMLENNNRINLYLNSPEELLKLMNAEVITQFVDTREDPDEEIDWESMIDVNSNNIQGIIKLKRALSDGGEKTTMTYVDPDTFQSYIDEYNETGSESAKKKALSHFTLGNGIAGSLNGVGIITGTGSFTKYDDLTDEQIKGIANLCKQEQGTLRGAAAEASLMANRFELYGSKYGTGGNGLYKYIKESGWFADAADYMDGGSASEDYVEVVKSVLVNGKRTLPGYIDEHVTLGTQWIVSATNDGSSINVMDRNAYIQNKTIIQQSASLGSGKYTFYCFPDTNSDPFGYISEQNRSEIGDAYYDFDTGELVNGKQENKESSNDTKDVSSSREWCWPTDGTRITSTFGPRSAPVPGASTDHGAIDIGVPTGTNVYACDSGKVTISKYSDSAGNYVTIDHGNGYITKYMHNSQLKVSVGDTVKKGQVIALSGSTGYSSGPHVHFQVEYNGTKMDPMLFKYNNGMGDGTISVGNTGIASLNNVLFIGDSILGSCKSALESEGAKVLYQSSENASFFLGDETAKMSDGVCSKGEKFNWESKIGSLDKPSGIYLMLGQNSCAGGANTSVLNAAVDDIKQLVEKLQKQFPDVPIFINSVVPSTNSGSYYYNGKYNEGMKKLNELLESYCSNTNNVLYVYTLDGYIEDSGCAKSEMSSDGLHPNKTGVNKLIENIKKKIISVSSSTGGSKYYAIVATWNETTDKIESNDPEQETYTKVKYTMTTTNINYQDAVRQYTMPFDYLWSMLVISEDKDFVFDLADLVYNSKIEITVFDNLTINTNVNVYTYTRKKKTETEAEVTVTGVSGETSSTITEKGNWPPDEDEYDYKTTYTTINKNNTMNIAVTLADVWMAKYVQEYMHEIPEDLVSNSEEILEDIGYMDTPSAEEHDDCHGHAKELLNSTKQKMRDNGYSSVSGKINYVNEEVYYATINRKQNMTNTVESTKYVSSPMVAFGKVDKESEEPNFVTIFLDSGNTKAKNNILSVESWLFELLEINEKTVDLLDLTKFLLYKATNIDYGVTEFNFSEYSPSAFTNVSGIYGGTIQEKIWFALINEGYSEIAAAAVLGNIAQESNFRADVVNSIGASGLCQWLGGRKTQLVAYANSKGVDWTDVDTQIEFLLAEVTPGGKGIATYQFLQKKYATGWKDATNIGSATEAFCWGFERCGKNEARMSYRISMAEKYYNEFKGKTMSSSDSRIGTISLSGDNANKMMSMLVEACRICDDNSYTYSQSNRYGAYQYDCSSFVARLYQQFFGINMPSTTDDYANFSQYYVGTYGAVELKPGDVLYRSGHVELYIGNGNRAGAHSSKLAISEQISVKSSAGNFTSVYRFIN